MKKAITVLFSAGLLLTAAAAWASNECYTLSGADYFGGDMSLKLTLQTPSGGVDRVSGQGEDSRGDSFLLQGATHPLGGDKEFSLLGSGPTGSGGAGGEYVIYSFHLNLSRGDGGWTGSYAGELHTTRGAEKDVSGAATETSCP
jgi:hypothetical protein